MIELLRTAILSDAYALPVALKAEGIEAVVQGEHTVAIIAGGVSVSIHDADAERARAVLEEFRR